MATWREQLEQHRGRIFLSYGGGVNSKAVYFLLIENGFVPNKDFYALYANHGGDCPETMQDIEDMNAKGFPVDSWSTYCEGHDTIFDYFWSKKALPSITNKSKDCTFKFKIDPIHKAVKWIMNVVADTDTYVQVLGIDAGESHRGHQTEHNGIPNIYPLKEEGYDREGCKEVIRRNGQKVPAKSACFFCPNRKNHEWRQLRRDHPELFFAASALEERNNTRRVAEGKKEIYLHRGKPLTIGVDEDLMVLSGEFAKTPHVETYLPLASTDQEYLAWLVEAELKKFHGINGFILDEYEVNEIMTAICAEYGVRWFENVVFNDQDRTFVLNRKQGRTIRAGIRRAIKVREELLRAEVEVKNQAAYEARIKELEEDGTLQWMLDNGYAQQKTVAMQLAA